MEERFGLLTASMDPIPLSGVAVTGEIAGRGARVKVAQRFRNAERKAVEAVYRFPLPESSAICGFRASLGGRTILGAVEEREKAFEIYDKALADGHGGFLLDQERPNIFTLSVGNLEAGTEAVVEMEYVQLLDKDGRTVRFQLPTTISPRYLPADAPDENGIPASDRIHPEYADRVPYGVSVAMTVRDAASVESVESPSHAIRVAMGPGPDAVGVTFSAGEARMDRDFVLAVTHRAGAERRAWRAKDGLRTYVQLDMAFAAEEAAGGDPGKKEVTFLLDCSGSMQGDSIGQAKKALDVCLKALPPGSFFNIVRFGSTFESLFPAAREYGERTLGEAVGWLSRVDADLGGTEVLPPLRHVYAGGAARDREGHVILLTDGEVGNEAEVADLVRENAEGIRFFAVGIGAGPNEHLIRSLSRAGRGGSAFIFPGERIEPKMLSLFQAVLEARLEKLSFEWAGPCVQAPLDPTVLSGTASTVLARMDGDWNAGEVRVRAEVRGKPVEWTVPVADAGAGAPPLPVLWARERIRDLEETQGDSVSRGSRQRRPKSEQWKREVVELAREYGLMSQETSFVAVEERAEKDRTTGEVVLRKVPTLVTVGWHGRGSVDACLAMPAPMPTVARESAFRVAAAPTAFSGLAQGTAFLRHAVSGKDRAKKRAGKSDAFDVRDAEAKARPELADAPADGTDLLLRLLSLQRADGGFDIDEEALRALGVDAAAVRKAAQAASGPQEETLRTLHTALVLEALGIRFGGRRAEWSAAVKKSRDWLARITKERGLLVEGLPPTAWAAGVLRNAAAF